MDFHIGNAQGEIVAAQIIDNVAMIITLKQPLGNGLQAQAFLEVLRGCRLLCERCCAQVGCPFYCNLSLPAYSLKIYLMTARYFSN
jgi:hypothetical protein